MNTGRKTIKGGCFGKEVHVPFFQKEHTFWEYTVGNVYNQHAVVNNNAYINAIYIKSMHYVVH